METKLDSRQGQFPATFPDTFKDFFAMMSEDEDHLDLFSNLLEDKVIPRRNKFNQHRCGGSLRCTNTTNATRGSEAGNSNVGRSNSFRFNRTNGSTSTSSSYCKHVRYCCLHQKHYSQNLLECNSGHGSTCRRGVCVGESGNDDNNTNPSDGVRSGGAKQTTNSNRRTIMERSFEFDSCDDSDTISTASSTPTIPYSVLNRHNFHHQPQRKQSQHHHPPSIINQPKGFLTKDANSTLQRIGSRGVDGNPTGNSLASGPLNTCNSGIQSSRYAISGSNNCLINTSSAIHGSMHCVAPSGPGSTNSAGARHTTNMFMDLNLSPEHISKSNMLTGGGNTAVRPGNLRAQKSPILSRRRSSSIAANLLAADIVGYRNTSDEPIPRNHSTIPHSHTRERIQLVKSPVSTKGKLVSSMPVESSGGVLTLKQAMSGAVSPQYSATSPLHMIGSGSGSSNAMTSVLEASTDCSTSPNLSPTLLSSEREEPIGRAGVGAGLGGDRFFCGSSMAITQLGSKQKQRLRTSSMPAESRKPRLADTRRAAIHCADLDLEYYRLRSFSITSHGVCNLGDSLRSRRSRSINSVISTATSNSGKDRNNSNASRTSGEIIFEKDRQGTHGKQAIPAYKIAMLGASGVGKTALTYQFTTSEYICAYDLSLDDDYGQKTVSILVDGIETDLEIIDHPACEMSTESFCATYNIDLFVVVYSVVDKSSFKAAEKALQYLKENEMLLTRGAILVGNKTDLERHREVTRQNARKLAKEIGCKFIETSSGLDHNVDELLVGIVAQVKLNPKRIENLSEKDRQRLSLQTTLQKHRRMQTHSRKIVRQVSMCKQEETDENSSNTANRSKTGSIRKRTLNLESILKMGESEMEDEDEISRLKYGSRNRREHFKTITINSDSNNTASSNNSSPKSHHSSHDSTSANYRKDSYTAETSLLEDCNKKTVSKLTNRTKVFLSSVLKFKKALNVRRRSSSSCSDLFVI